MSILKVDTLQPATGARVSSAGHIIDMGPDGGVKGGNIIAEGKPEDICKVSGSYTGQFLKSLLR